MRNAWCKPPFDRVVCGACEGHTDPTNRYELYRLDCSQDGDINRHADLQPCGSYTQGVDREGEELPKVEELKKNTHKLSESVGLFALVENVKRCSGPTIHRFEG